MTGEIQRTFLKHVTDGSLILADLDETGAVLAATVVSDATTCRHTKDKAVVDDPATAKYVRTHLKDYAFFEPKCTDATHLLAEIGAAEKECAEAERAWKAAHSEAKALKETLEQAQDHLRQLVRDAIDPQTLPLFDTPAA